MSAISRPVQTVPTQTRRVLLTGVLAAALSSAAVLLVAAAGKAAGAAHVQQLSPGPLLFLTIAGVAAGTATWNLVRRRAKSPLATLRRLVPAVLVISFAPDLAIGIGGTPWSSIATLMSAHVAVFLCTIPLLIHRLPPPR